MKAFKSKSPSCDLYLDPMILCFKMGLQLTRAMCATVTIVLGGLYDFAIRSVTGASVSRVVFTLYVWICL